MGRSLPLLLPGSCCHCVPSQELWSRTAAVVGSDVGNVLGDDVGVSLGISEGSTIG